MPKSMQQQDAPVSRDQLREQIRQTVRDAQVAAEKAAAEAAQARAQVQVQGNGRQIIIGPPSVPVAGTQQNFPFNQIPPQAEDIAIAFFVVIGAVIVGLPIMRAIARRIERGAPQPAQIPNDVRQQLQQLSASVEAIAIEVERISEGQRFTTKVLTEKTREGSV